jgi:phosphoglycolate phosphatase
MPFKLLVYDLDGTLFETLPDLARSVNQALAVHGHATVTEAEVRRAIGDGARILIARLVPAGSSEVEIDRVWSTFREIYETLCADTSFLLPGVERFLEARHAEGNFLRQAILTNKPQAPSDVLAQRFRLDRWIGRVIGGDTSLGRKPDPAGLLSLMQEAQASPLETLMIGDGPADLEVARRAGVRCVLVEGGYGDARELEGLPWSWKVADFLELADLWAEIEAD